VDASETVSEPQKGGENSRLGDSSRGGLLQERAELKIGHGRFHLQHTLDNFFLSFGDERV